MRPEVICHMLTPLDGRVVVSQWSRCPDATTNEYVALYFDLYRKFDPKGYIVGRITMEPYADGRARSPRPGDRAARPVHVAQSDPASIAVVLDPSGKLHWSEGELDGEHLVIVVGPKVSDSYLCELAERGLSYFVSDSADIDPLWLLQTLRREFGAQRMMVEGGGVVNGKFLAAGVVDEISLLLVPAIDGTTGTRTIFEGGPAGLGGKVALRFRSSETLKGGALHLRYGVEKA
jgi:riboflavin biosynthesis pyrimidine reductase